MEWMTLAGTGLGAIVGVGSTLVADHTRWRRDAIDRSRQERKDIYIACLTTFRQAHEAMRAVATGDQREPQGAAAVDARVREAFRASGCNEARESAVICVPPELVSAIQVAYLSLRTIRDVLASGSPLDSAPYQDARREHRRATRSAQAQMRIDLGSSRRARSGRRPRSVPRTPRRAARIAVLDPEGRVFLLCYDNEEVGVHWAMPGGGLEPGESPREGALREMREETGWDDLTPGPLLCTWEHDFTRAGVPVRQHEHIYVARGPHREPNSRSAAARAEEGILAWRWRSPQELAASGDAVWPPQLARLLVELESPGPSA